MIRISWRFFHHQMMKTTIFFETRLHPIKIYQTNDEVEHKIYISKCWKKIKHFSSAFWRCGNGLCSLINLQGFLNEFKKNNSRLA
jgi:hypothetical protein